MPTPNRPPIQITPEKPQPLQRHHTARYYAHRVRESLATRVSKTICIVFLSVLLVLGIVAFILWLSLRPHRPRFHVHEFSVPGLDQPTGFENAQIAFKVTARNSNQHIGINYYSMEGMVYYRDQEVGSTHLKDPFYQEPKTTTVLDATLSGATLTVSSRRWEEFMNDRGKGKVVFRLDIKSVVRFKVSTWDFHRHTMHATCDVEVGPNGSILPTSKDKRCPVYFT
ncbi:hypothetical protein QYF36_023339 [Acer negundo]|nr:hypothetical protein QYF36_023339 [Acer negundo]